MRAPLIIAAAGVAVVLTAAGPAQAQANRTFVSGQGSDSNPCSLGAPCRSFAQALSQTNPGGEIAVLDTAGYGAVTITKSISIVAPDGIEGGVTTASATNAITVTVGASDVVNLRGLTLSGGGVGSNGILFNNLGTLNIQNCIVRGFTNAGLTLVPTGTAAFNVADTIVSNSGVAAVALVPFGSGTVRAAFNRAQAIEAGDNGFEIDGSNALGAIKVTIADSVVTNSATGIRATSNTGQAVTQVMVTNSVVSNNNSFGVFQTGPNAATWLARNTISGNATAFAADSGTLFSFGDNDIASNTNDGGAIPLVATK